MNTKTSIIENILLNEIITGQIPPGSKIQSRNQLCKRFHCSRTIIEKVILSLTRSGYLSGIQGSGTYVLSSTAGKQKIRNLKIITDFTISSSTPLLPSLNLDNLNISVEWISYNQIIQEFNSFNLADTAVIFMRPAISAIPLLEKMKKHNIPVLLLNRDYDGFDNIITDPASSIREGLSWLLIESGRDIAFVSRRPSISRPYIAERILAFYETAIELGAHLTPEWCISKNFNNFTEEIAETGLHLFGNKKRPQGIFILSIDLVLPLIAYGKSCGYSPGTDYKLLTFDYLNELSHIKNIAMMKQPDLLYEQEIVRWLQSVHSNTPFHSSLKTDLQIF